MNLDDLLEEIITELGYRVDNGIPDLTNKEHISILSEILSDFGLSEIKHDIIRNILKEESEEEKERNEKRFKSPELNKMVSYESEDGEERSGLVGNLLRLPDDSPGRIEAEKHVPEEGTEERDRIDKELGNEGDGAGDDAPQPNEKEDGEDTEQDDEEQKRKTKAMYSTPDQKAILDKEREVLDGEKDDPKPTEFPEKSEPQPGQLSDVNDEFSDGEIKQKALEYGTKNPDKFKKAPGNVTSMVSEILSGEGYSYLEDDPDMSVEELAEKFYDQIIDTELGSEIGTGKKYKGNHKFAGKRQNLIKNLVKIAEASKVKFTRTKQAIGRLQEDGMLSEETHIRNYYGHEVSKEKQKKLVNSLSGPFYTREGDEIPKDELLDFIENAGGGENPSDTSTITVDSQGRALVEFHSDKMTPADIQANSTPNKEAENAIELVKDESLNLSGQVRQQAVEIIEQGQSKLEQKENELKSAAEEPARQMAQMDVSKILEDIKSDKGITGRDKVSSKLSSLTAYGRPHKYIQPYLPEQDDSYSDEQLLKAFYEFAGDPDKFSSFDNPDEEDMTGDQVKLLFRSAKQQGFDISGKLGKIREESIEIQRNTHQKLNERSVTLPNGDSKPLGDYIEGKNIIDKFHIGVIDGEDGEGVAKYDGLFNVNMGGTLVTKDILKKSLNVSDTDDFITHLDVGSPGEGDEYTKNSDGEITGRNIFIYAVTKKGKKIKVGFKTQRSKQGQSGKLNTTYQWDKQMIKLFERNQPDIVN